MKFLLPAFFLLVSMGLFFLYIDTAYQNVQFLQTEQSSFNDALQKSKELQSIRDVLLSKYNTFTSSDLDRLEKMLPDNIDNVRLVLEIDSIATKYGTHISAVAVDSDSTSISGEGVIGGTGEQYETIILSFSMTSSYDDFVRFLKDLESSLRIVDITAINFTSADNISGVYDYKVSIKTYWLK